MPIDPYAALNAMIRAEATRFTPPVRQADPAAAAKTATAAESPGESESEPQRTAAADSAA
ncbi:hypothetical protein [Streptomyces sp. NPDC048269]|uniref:hypothetical protein n=1 Tax=Streptomyces sp. NPDC048269 TaxID=3155753 RepID=UPI00342ADD19